MEDAVKTTELSKLVKWFEESQDATLAERKQSERCRDYYDGKQLTLEEIEALARRGQPAVVNNLVKPKVDAARGLEQESRTDPKAFPRNPNDDEDAEAATDAIRYVCDANDFAVTRSEVFENLYVEGAGGCEVIVEPKGEEFDVKIVHHPWDRIGADPHSRVRDYSDARYKYVVKWMDEEDVRGEPRWKDASEDAISGAYTASSGTNTTDDVPRVKWSDPTRKRVRVVCMYYRERGRWKCAYFTAGGFLEEPKDSPYLDEDGEPMCAIELQSALVDRDGARYGEVKQFLDPQDEVNKRRSKALHLAISNQSKGEKGAVTDVAEAKAEKAKPDGHIEYNPGMAFDFIDNTAALQAQFEFLQESKSQINEIGPNPTMMGTETRSLSGRALQQLDQRSKTQIGPVYDCLKQWQKRVYRQIWCRIRQFWTGPKWIRVTDDDRNIKFVGLNQPITHGEVTQKLQAMGHGMPAEYMGMPPDTVVGMKHEVAKMMVDIIIEEAPDTVTIQSEQFEQLVAVYPSVPDQMKPAAFELLIEASSIRNKKQFLDKLKGANDPQAAAAQQQQQALAQKAAALKLAELSAKVGKTQAETAKIQAEAQRGPEVRPTGKSPSESISYKDAPPDIRRQMEAQAGMTPSSLHDADVRGAVAEASTKESQAVETMARAHQTAMGPQPQEMVEE